MDTINFLYYKLLLFLVTFKMYRIDSYIRKEKGIEMIVHRVNIKIYIYVFILLRMKFVFTYLFF